MPARPTMMEVKAALQRRLQAGDLQGAAQLASVAVADGLEDARLFTLSAFHHLGATAFDLALDHAERALALAPRDVDALTAKAVILSRMNRSREALSVFDAALRIAPSSAQLHFQKACALTDLNELPRAQREFERTLQLQPAHVEALSRLANLAAQRGDTGAARDYSMRSLKLDPQQLAVRLTLAQADLEEENYQAALDGVSAVRGARTLAPVNAAVAEGLMGDALDALGRTQEAFVHYTRCNDIQRELHRGQFEDVDGETALERVCKRIAYFKSVPAQTWHVAPSVTPSSRRVHVFLVGFPRSGTTLLEQVLASHPDVESMEERDCLNEAADEFVYPVGGLDRLAALPPSALDAWRDVYWGHVADAGLSAAKPVFIDKLPLNTVLLCLVAKLFPQAKILFALRDPRDVVLSCFRRRFRMNAQMYELLTLPGAAHYYDATMQLADLYRAKLGLEIFDARYETLVSDFDGETERLCAFLGIGTDQGMRAFAEKVKQRGVATPSAVQVARGLYTQGMEQWRRYAQELAPVMPILAPWVARFEYSPQ